MWIKTTLSLFLAFLSPFSNFFASQPAASRFWFPISQEVGVFKNPITHRFISLHKKREETVFKKDFNEKEHFFNFLLQLPFSEDKNKPRLNLFNYSQDQFGFSLTGGARLKFLFFEPEEAFAEFKVISFATITGQDSLLAKKLKDFLLLAEGSAELEVDPFQRISAKGKDVEILFWGFELRKDIRLSFNPEWEEDNLEISKLTSQDTFNLSDGAEILPVSQVKKERLNPKNFSNNVIKTEPFSEFFTTVPEKGYTQLFTVYIQESKCVEGEGPRNCQELEKQFYQKIVIFPGAVSKVTSDWRRWYKQVDSYLVLSPEVAGDENNSKNFFYFWESHYEKYYRLKIDLWVKEEIPKFPSYFVEKFSFRNRSEIIPPPPRREKESQKWYLQSYFLYPVISTLVFVLVGGLINMSRYLLWKKLKKKI